MFRFTIRDLLWLMVVVALGVGWWLSYRDSRRRFSDLEQRYSSQETLLVRSRDINRALREFLNARGYRDYGLEE